MGRTEEITTTVDEKIDSITGEILKTTSETKRVIAFSGRESDKDKDYLKVYPVFFSSFLKELKIADSKPRIMIYLMFKASELKINSDNAVYASNEELMRELNISKPTLINGLKALCDIGIIKRLTPRVPIYQVNPAMIYKGSLAKFCREHE